MRLLLFDIDGTLLTVHHGLSKNIFCQALSETFDRPIIWQGYPGNRYTDKAMALDLIHASGYHGDPTAELRRAFARMGQLWGEHRDTAELHIFSGVRDLLSKLSQQEQVTLGIVTANGRPSAWGKLNAAQLQHIPFQVGAYGHEATDRNDLPQLAIDRASQLLGQPINGQNTIVIGDTPADIACARAVGAKAVAVATGRYSPTDLAPHQPDTLLETLSDVHQVFRLLTR